MFDNKLYTIISGVTGISSISICYLQLLSISDQFEFFSNETDNANYSIYLFGIVAIDCEYTLHISQSLSLFIKCDCNYKSMNPIEINSVGFWSNSWPRKNAL